MGSRLAGVEGSEPPESAVSGVASLHHGHASDSRVVRLLRAAYHLPGNADVRVHLLAAALVTGWFSAELAVVAAYYNLRWIARYVLVARRLGGDG